MDDLTGMIFKIEKKEYGNSPIKTEYWLITGPARSWGSYPAARCSSTGKTYKDTNGWSTKPMQDLQKNKTMDLRRNGIGNLYTVVREPGAYASRKANITESIEITKTKNRISYLEGRITQDTKELAKARQTLEALQMYK